MGIKSTYHQILRDLYASEKGILAFTLHRRYNITPTEIISFLSEYQEMGYILLDKENRISLTSYGRNEIIKEFLKTSNSNNVEKGLSFFSLVSSKQNIGINEPYIPQLDFGADLIKGGGRRN